MEYSNGKFAPKPGRRRLNKILPGIFLCFILGKIEISMLLAATSAHGVCTRSLLFPSAQKLCQIVGRSYSYLLQFCIPFVLCENVLCSPSDCNLITGRSMSNEQTRCCGRCDDVNLITNVHRFFFLVDFFVSIFLVKFTRYRYHTSLVFINVLQILLYPNTNAGNTFCYIAYSLHLNYILLRRFLHLTYWLLFGWNTSETMRNVHKWTRFNYVTLICCSFTRFTANLDLDARKFYYYFIDSGNLAEIYFIPTL